MPLSPELLLELVDQLEEQYIEIIALRSILVAFDRVLPPGEELNQLLESAKQSPYIGGRWRGRFDELRQLLREDQSLERALEELLRALPVPQRPT